MNNLVRCFISLELSEDVKTELIRLQKELKKTNLFKGTFPKIEALHLTIKFFGEIDKFKLEEIKKRLSNISSNIVKLKLRNAGFFGYEPKIIWVGVDSDELRTLYNKIEDNIWDILPSKRQFKAHITIAKVNSIKYQMLLKKTINELKVNPTEAEVDKFYLKESKLLDGEYKHFVLEEYDLK